MTRCVYRSRCVHVWNERRKHHYFVRFLSLSNYCFSRYCVHRIFTLISVLHVHWLLNLFYCFYCAWCAMVLGLFECFSYFVLDFFSYQIDGCGNWSYHHHWRVIDSLPMRIYIDSICAANLHICHQINLFIESCFWPIKL